MTNAERKQRARRCVIKAGTAVLTRPDGSLDRATMSEICRQLIWLHRRGWQPVLVTSGAVASGRGRFTAPTTVSNEKPQDVDARPDVPRFGTSVASLSKPAYSAIGQARIVAVYAELLDALYSEEAGVHGPRLCPAQALLTRGAFAEHARYESLRATLGEMLDNHVLPIVNTNDLLYVDTIDVFSDNDHLASYLVAMLEADVLVLLTDVAGVYTRNPKLHPDAERIEEIVGGEPWPKTDIDDSTSSAGGMRSKMDAMRLMEHLGVSCWIVQARQEEALVRALDAHDTRVGTWLNMSPAKRKRLSQMERWLLAGASPVGTVVVSEAGTEKMRHARATSLLAVGVQTVVGEFSRDSVIAIRGTDYELIGVGRSRLSSDELREIALAPRPSASSRKRSPVVVHTDYFSLRMALFGSNERAAVAASSRRRRNELFTCSSRKEGIALKRNKEVLSEVTEPKAMKELLDDARRAHQKIGAAVEDWLLLRLSDEYYRSSRGAAGGE